MKTSSILAILSFALTTYAAAAKDSNAAKNDANFINPAASNGSGGEAAAALAQSAVDAFEKGDIITGTAATATATAAAKKAKAGRRSRNANLVN